MSLLLVFSCHGIFYQGDPPLLQQSWATSGAPSTQTWWYMSKSAVCLDRASSSLLGRKKVQQCKSGSPNLFPDKILARTEHDSLIQRPHLFSQTCLMTKSGYGQGRTWWECILNIMQDRLWTELQVCSAQLISQLPQQFLSVVYNYAQWCPPQPY